jgi:capsular exopolysaccharide synthesis family protein
MVDREHNREINLRDYWQILVRRRWLIYTCILMTTVAAAVSSFVATPLFRSTCVVSIERSPVRILSNDLTSSSPSWLDYQNFYNTQYRIIESDRVLRMAAERKLDLPNRPDVLETDRSPLFNSLRALRSRVTSLVRGGDSESAAGPEDPFAPYVSLLRSGLSVAPVRESFLVEISFVSADPEFSREVANAIAEAYRDFTLFEKKDIAEQSSAWFVDQIGALRKEINDLEKDVQDYTRESNIVLGEKGAVSRTSLTDLIASYTQAQIATASARATRDSIAGTDPEALEEVRRNALVQQLSKELATLQSEYRELLSRLGPNHPDVRTRKAKIETVTSQRGEEVQAIARRVYQAAVADYERAMGEERNIAVQLEKARVEADEFERVIVEFETMQRELDSKRATLNDLYNRQNNMTLSAALGDTAHNVRIIDFAKLPGGPYKPNKKLNILLGFLLGLFLGVGASVLMEYVDNTVKTPDDVRAVIGAAVLGLIPSQEAQSKGRKRGQKEAGEEPGLISARTPLSPISEAYRELRTAVLLATAGHPPRDLTVTSCQPSEGKTTTAINLAITLAQLGKRVLLVDTDLRRPRCHQVLKRPSSQGVSNFLTGYEEIENLIQTTEVERMDLLPAGPVPPNPAELLDSTRFIELVARLRDGLGGGLNRYDHLIFVSPPVLSVVDPLLIGRQTEGTVLVIRSAFTSREATRLGKEKLESGRVNLLGVLLNAVQTDHVPYQYRYYRYGYSRQGADGEKKDRSKRAVAGVGREA